MRSMSAHDAKARFGQLLDAVLTEPVMIKKHGREVAVVVSKEEFDAMQGAKLLQLREEVQKGIDSIESGRFIELEAADVQQLSDSVKSMGRAKISG